MAFNFNYKELEFEKVTPGIYEALVQNVSEQYTEGNGKKHLNVSIVIRNDVQQNHQNAMLNYKIWTSDRPDIKTIDGYVEFSLAMMCRACSLPEQINVGSVDELSKLWIRKPLRIKVEDQEYNGNTYANISRVDPTTNHTVNHIYKGKNQNQEPASSFVPRNNDDNIPF